MLVGLMGFVVHEHLESHRLQTPALERSPLWMATLHLDSHLGCTRQVTSSDSFPSIGNAARKHSGAEGRNAPRRAGSLPTTPQQTGLPFFPSPALAPCKQHQDKVSV
uniref:Uncharacterized protein n=1 Tax=Sphaerodactylus townsendi TaxID=933632 RepID=A0ACB8FXY3_9SAUR